MLPRVYVPLLWMWLTKDFVANALQYCFVYIMGTEKKKKREREREKERERERERESNRQTDRQTDKEEK